MTHSNTFNEFIKYYESRIMAKRHLSEDDKKSFVRDVKNAYSNNKLDVTRKEKNDEFIEEHHLTYEQVPIVIYKTLTPDDVVGVVKDNRKRRPFDALNDELYICEVKIPTKKKDPIWIYMKFQYLKNGGVRCESFHDNTEKIFVDYFKAQDYEDNSFMELVGKKWMNKYNTYDTNVNKITKFNVVGNEVTFLFARSLEICSEEENNRTLNGVMRSIPSNMGLDGYKMRKDLNHRIEKGNLIFKIFTRPFEKR